MIKFSLTLTACAFFLFLCIGLVFGQEATESAPEETITEEAATTTNATPRVVSQELLIELRNRQVDLEDAQKLVNYVLAKIIQGYQVDVRTEVINIITGEITTRPPVTQ